MSTLYDCSVPCLQYPRQAPPACTSAHCVLLVPLIPWFATLVCFAVSAHLLALEVESCESSQVLAAHRLVHSGTPLDALTVVVRHLGGVFWGRGGNGGGEGERGYNGSHRKGQVQSSKTVL